MRYRLSAFAATAAALLTSAAVISAPPAAAAASLISNGGFETGSLSGWSCSTLDSVVSSPVHSGSHALSGAASSSDDAQCSQSVSVQPSSNYTLTGWVEGNYVFLGDSGTGSSDTDTWTPSATSWQQLSTSFTTGAATTSVTIYVHGWYAQGTYFADDLSLTGPGGGGSPPGAPAGLTVTGTTSSSVSLSWTAPSGTVTGYDIYENGTRTATASGTSTTITGLAASTTYTFTVSAFNSAGEGPQSSSVQATTSSGGGGGGGLPPHVLMGYWQDFVNGATPLTLAQVPASYNLIAVAFGSATGTPGQVAFSLDPTLSSDLGGYTQQQFINDIHTLNARGQKVILSVGGANGTISVNDSASASEFASSVNSLIQQYGFNGVDIDLENGVNPAFMAQALNQLSSDDPGLLITLAPQTVDMQSTQGDYFQLALDIKSILTMVNVQFYNSGTMNGCDGNVYAEATENFLTALTCIELQGGLSPSQVGLGLPASPSAAGSGYTSPSVVNSALDCLAAGTSCGSFKPPATYPSIRGAMTWSINWDAANGYNFANTVAPHLSTLP
ncbi:MAG TPA: glycosyl hydrolase family 18 protein [Streptosporangiaceae bacterium]|nr:glycosyl hydrolase family 18 protein [Streptosporangiaceae bacterium]